MNIFSKGDRVRIISPKHGHEGKLFVIVEVLGSDDLAHELPYRISNNFWYKASELVLVQPAYAKEYAIGAPPAAETGARGDDDYPPADWTPPPLVGVMVMFDELLNQLSGKLSPSARQMLRTHFAAEHSIRTDAEAELASVRDQLAAAEAAHSDLLALIRKWTYTSMDGFTFVTDDHGEVAAAAQATGGSGEGVMDYQTKRERYHKKRSEYLQRRIDELKTALLWAQTGEERDRIIERINELQTQMDANDGK